MKNTGFVPLGLVSSYDRNATKVVKDQMLTLINKMLKLSTFSYLLFNMSLEVRTVHPRLNSTDKFSIKALEEFDFKSITE